MKHLNDLKPEDIPAPRVEHSHRNYKVSLRRPGVDYRGSAYGDTYTRTAEQAIAAAHRVISQAPVYAKPHYIAIAAREGDHPRGRGINFPMYGESVVTVNVREE